MLEKRLGGREGEAGGFKDMWLEQQQQKLGSTLGTNVGRR